VLQEIIALLPEDEADRIWMQSNHVDTVCGVFRPRRSLRPKRPRRKKGEP